MTAYTSHLGKLVNWQILIGQLWCEPEMLLFQQTLWVQLISPGLIYGARGWRLGSIGITGKPVLLLFLSLEKLMRFLSWARSLSGWHTR